MSKSDLDSEVIDSAKAVYIGGLHEALVLSSGQTHFAHFIPVSGAGETREREGRREEGERRREREREGRREREGGRERKRGGGSKREEEGEEGERGKGGRGRKGEGERGYCTFIVLC